MTLWRRHIGHVVQQRKRRLQRSDDLSEVNSQWEGDLDQACPSPESVIFPLYLAIPLFPEVF